MGNPLSTFQGRKVTEGYFIELLRPGREEHCKYSLKSEDQVVEVTCPDTGKVTVKLYPSISKLYMECEDLTEYTFAIQYFGSMDNWLHLCEQEWFQRHIQKWRTELELKLKSEALKAIIDEARLGGKNSYDAKKYLISKGWIDRTTESSRRGRPSRDEVISQAKEIAFSEKQLQEDMKRLGITNGDQIQETN